MGNKRIFSTMTIAGMDITTFTEGVNKQGEPLLYISATDMARYKEGKSDPRNVIRYYLESPETKEFLKEYGKLNNMWIDTEYEGKLRPAELADHNYEGKLRGVELADHNYEGKLRGVEFTRHNYEGKLRPALNSRVDDNISGIVRISGKGKRQGTYFVFGIGINFATHVNPKLSAHVIQMLISGTQQQDKRITRVDEPAPMLAYKEYKDLYLELYRRNEKNTPYGFFSIGNMVNYVIAKYFTNPHDLLRDKSFMPDLSVRIVFLRYIRTVLNVDMGELPCIILERFNGRFTIEKVYPMKYFIPFLKILEEEWVKRQAYVYFRYKNPYYLSELPTIYKRIKIFVNEEKKRYKGLYGDNNLF